MSELPERLRDEVLHVIALGQGRYGWHAIATRLSDKDVPRVPELPDVLRALRQARLVAPIDGAEGGTRWRLTPKGVSVLSNRRGAPSSAAFARDVRVVADLLHSQSSVVPDDLLVSGTEPTPDEAAWRELLIGDARFAMERALLPSSVPPSVGGALKRHRDRALSTGDWRTFMERLRNIRRLPPSMGLYFRGRAWQALGFYGLAAALYQRALLLDPRNHRIDESRVNALVDAEDWERLQTVIADVRADPSAHLELALVAEVAAYRAMLAERDPVAPSRYEDVARRLSELLAEPESEEIVRAVAASGAVAAALCFDNAGVETQARHFAERATHLLHDSGSAWLARGLIGHRHGSSEAREHLHEAAQAMPWSVWPPLYLAHLAVLGGRYDECLRWCEKALPLATSDVVRAALHEWRGISRAVTEDGRSEARDDLELAIALDPGQSSYRVNLDAFDHAALPLQFELKVSEALRAQTTRALTFATPVELAA